jgi:hypothetical protein
MGNFNGVVAVVMGINPTMAEYGLEIGGEIFHELSSAPIHIWKDGAFFDVKQAYENGLITLQDVRNIFTYYWER